MKKKIAFLILIVLIAAGTATAGFRVYRERTDMKYIEECIRGTLEDESLIKSLIRGGSVLSSPRLLVDYDITIFDNDGRRHIRGLGEVDAAKSIFASNGQYMYDNTKDDYIAAFGTDSLQLYFPDIYPDILSLEYEDLDVYWLGKLLPDKGKALGKFVDFLSRYLNNSSGFTSLYSIMEAAALPGNPAMELQRLPSRECMMDGKRVEAKGYNLHVPPKDAIALRGWLADTLPAYADSHGRDINDVSGKLQGIDIQIYIYNQKIAAIYYYGQKEGAEDDILLDILESEGDSKDFVLKLGGKTIKRAGEVRGDIEEGQLEIGEKPGDYRINHKTGDFYISSLDCKGIWTADDENRVVFAIEPGKNHEKYGFSLYITESDGTEAPEKLLPLGEGNILDMGKASEEVLIPVLKRFTPEIESFNTQ